MNPTIFHDYSAHEDLTLTLCDLGASLYAVKYQGKLMNYTPDEETFAAPNGEFFGQFVGPVVGRIKGGVIGGFEFAPNENGNTLHSSSFCFSWKPFRRDVRETPEAIIVEFTLQDELFGGDFIAKAEYKLYRAYPRFALRLSFASTSACPCNLTTHVYWSLGEEDMSNIVLRVDNPSVMSYGPGAIPAKYVKATGIYDFREGLPLKEAYDHTVRFPGGMMNAYGKTFGMRLKTDADAAQLYVDGPSKAKTGKSKGFAFECQRHPLLNEEMILPPGITETTTIEYEFYRR